MQQIELSLRRHRESELHQGQWRFGTTPLRARVNIPAFQATFFKDGVAAKQHNVIVGNNAVEVDYDSGRKGHYNHTRMFSAEMATVVLNPVWRVPKRIKEQELDQKLMDEPDFYEKHNYEVKTLPDGTEQVTQLSGPGNALGLVKFLFPNEFAIYMHDTPNKRLFKRTIRAFSHGCMRTENPLDLAKWLLVDQGEWSEEKFQQVLDSRQEYGVALKTKIPITIDYNTVGVHSSGRMMFYADVYRYDKAYFEGNVPFRQDRDHPLTIVY
ncbi:MAG: L,D-transpeptidase family protein [Myxococcales bacterium]|nr:L,D-transpeptidase family protein [Myxococcales bacterium]